MVAAAVVGFGNISTLCYISFFFGWKSMCTRALKIYLHRVCAMAIENKSAAACTHVGRFPVVVIFFAGGDLVDDAAATLCSCSRSISGRSLFLLFLQRETEEGRHTAADNVEWCIQLLRVQWYFFGSCRSVTHKQKCVICLAVLTHQNFVYPPVLL